MADNYRIARDEIKSEIRNNIPLINALREFSQNNAGFYPGYGNLGDALISVGTLDLFDDLGLSFPLIRGRHTDVFSGHQHVVIGGGGGWVRGLWETYLEPVKMFLHAGGQLLILPSSFANLGSEFIPFSDQITIFCRERKSCDDLLRQGFPESRLFLCHDLAFYTDQGHFQEFEKPGFYPDLKMLRKDEETIQTSFPRDNVDFSLLFNDIQWDAKLQCLPPLRVAASLISEFTRVETDRLHMTVLSALLGRQVSMRSNSYFKNKAVFDYSLARFPNVRFVMQEECRSSQELGRDAEVRVLRDTLRRTNFSLQYEKEKHTRSLQQNDKLLRRLEETSKMVHNPVGKSENYYEEIIKQKDNDLQKIYRSKIYKLQNRYYSLYGVPVIGFILKKIRSKLIMKK